MDRQSTLSPGVDNGPRLGRAAGGAWPPARLPGMDALADQRAPSRPAGTIMRHALFAIRLLDWADGAVAQTEADERLEHQSQAKPRAKPAEPGRVVTPARRVRALVAR